MSADRLVSTFEELDDVPAPAGDGVWSFVNGAYVWTPMATVQTPANGSVTTAKLAAGRPVDAAHMSIDYGVPGPTGSFLVPPCSVTSGATPVLNTIYFCPFWVQAGWRFTGILADVTVAGLAGDMAELGLYADDGNGRPGVRLLDAGSISISATGNKQINVAYQPAGDALIWGALGITVMTGTPAFERCNANSGGPLAQIASTMTTNSIGWSLAGQAGLPADLTGMAFVLNSNPQRVALVFA